MVDDYETPIHHEQAVLGNIAKHFNNKDASDVTLTVGDQSYHVHRFILSAQSSVFHTMLMNGQWKESDAKVIKLEESPECEVVFGDFLRYFYTGTLTLSCNNVCGIHMLADKYDLTSMKEDAVSVMKDVLTGVQGKAYPSSIMWLPYIEQFIPDLLSICYEAIRINFYGCTNHGIDKFTKVLESRHMQEILTKNDVAAYNEFRIFTLISTWATLRFADLSGDEAKTELKPILQLIRFYNMNSEDLQKVEESTLCKAFGKSFITDYTYPAFKVHSEMLRINGTILKCFTPSGIMRIVKGDYLCPCDSHDNCPHLNPRLYFNIPYGILVPSTYITKSRACIPITPIDLGDLGMYAKLCTHPGESSDESWRFKWKGDYQPSQQYDRDTFTLTPKSVHIGRRCTVAVIATHAKPGEYLYAIKNTCTVKNRNGIAEPISMYSPKRPKGLWDINHVNVEDDEKIWIGVAVHLSKE